MNLKILHNRDAEAWDVKTLHQRLKRQRTKLCQGGGLRRFNASDIRASITLSQRFARESGDGPEKRDPESHTRFSMRIFLGFHNLSITQWPMNPVGFDYDLESQVAATCCGFVHSVCMPDCLESLARHASAIGNQR